MLILLSGIVSNLLRMILLHQNMLIECTSFQILDLYGKILPVLFLALRPIFVFLDSDKEPESNENGLGIISKLKDGSLDASTLIQVNATIMIGVVFFVSISSALSLETVEGGSFVLVLVSVTIILPFAVSAILIIIQKRASRIAWGFTAFGFALLFLALLYISLIEFDTGFTRLEPTITGFQCAANPSEYGINESYLWKCSMFTPGSLAEACAIAPYNFNMELSECHKFIPPSTESGG